MSVTHDSSGHAGQASRWSCSQRATIHVGTRKTDSRAQPSLQVMGMFSLLLAAQTKHCSATKSAGKQRGDGYGSTGASGLMQQLTAG